MNARTPLLAALVAGALVFAGASLAQDQPAAQTPPPIVTVRSVPPAAPQIATPPPFKQLAGNGKWITQEQADAYPPLANDFLHASHNGKRVSKAQYEAWVKQLQ